MALKYAGAAYLLYLAWRVWSAPPAGPAAAPPAEHRLRLFSGALAIMLGNPKSMLFYLALLPSLVDLAALTAPGYAQLAAVTFAVATLVDGSYVLLASRVRRLFAAPRAARWANRGAGIVMAGTALAIASR